MEIIPIEYVIYCSGALTVSVITALIKNFYNIRDTGVMKGIIKKSGMKKVESMSVIMDRKKYDISLEEQGYIKAHCFDKIPEDNKYVSLWLKSLLNKKGTVVCASPNCVNMLNNKKEIFMAFDSKFCSVRCRAQAQNYLGKYWNIGK